MGGGGINTFLQFFLQSFQTIHSTPIINPVIIIPDIKVNKHDECFISLTYLKKCSANRQILKYPINRRNSQTLNFY